MFNFTSTRAISRSLISNLIRNFDKKREQTKKFGSTLGDITYILIPVLAIIAVKVNSKEFLQTHIVISLIAIAIWGFIGFFR